MSNSNLSREKLNLETAQIPWQELQRFFAQGYAISVAKELDLVAVAHAFSIDQTSQVKQWLSAKQIEKVNDHQSLHWLEQDMRVWAVIVKPWVLVQSNE